MSSNKKIRNRLNKLFEDIKQTEEPGELPVVKKASPPAPALPPEAPQKPLYTRSLSPDTLPVRPPIAPSQTQTMGASTFAVPFQAGGN